MNTSTTSKGRPRPKRVSNAAFASLPWPLPMPSTAAHAQLERTRRREGTGEAGVSRCCTHFRGDRRRAEDAASEPGARPPASTRSMAWKMSCRLAAAAAASPFMGEPCAEEACVGLVRLRALRRRGEGPLRRWLGVASALTLAAADDGDVRATVLRLRGASAAPVPVAIPLPLACAAAEMMAELSSAASPRGVAGGVEGSAPSGTGAGAGADADADADAAAPGLRCSTSKARLAGSVGAAVTALSSARRRRFSALSDSMNMAALCSTEACEVGRERCVCERDG